MRRKIAAILAADIVGYSRLVGDDEEDTLRRLENYRAVFSDIINRFGGRIFNTAGDAILAEFASAVDAVRCAVDTQESVRTRNLGYPPSRQMYFRIGITIGDVVESEGDLLGEGVNVASRLEGIAPAGGICISRSVHEAVANKMSLKFFDVGEQQLKNLPDPVHAYTVTLEPSAITKGQRLHRALAKPMWVGAAVAAVLAVLAARTYIHDGLVQPTETGSPQVIAAAPLKPPETIMQLAATPPPDAEANQAIRPVTGPEAADPDADKASVEKANDDIESAANSDQLAGDWKGTLTENDGDTYNVEISIAKDGKGSIRYPKLKCSGTLEYMLRRGTAHVFREKITKGTVCGKTAEVELTVTSADGSTVDYYWIGKGPIVTGSLSGAMAANGEACQKYLPNRGTIVDAPCGSEPDVSDSAP